MLKALCRRMRSDAHWHLSQERVFFLLPFLQTNLREITRQDWGRKRKKVKVISGDGAAASQDLKSAFVFFLLFFMDDKEVTMLFFLYLLVCFNAQNLNPCVFKRVTARTTSTWVLSVL